MVERPPKSTKSSPASGRSAKNGKFVEVRKSEKKGSSSSGSKSGGSKKKK